MDEYVCRYGTDKKDRPAHDLYEQPYTHKDDDGAIVHVTCDTCLTGDGTPHRPCFLSAPICTDCGVGTLQWAEAGFTPYHRICDHCGSHWEMFPDGPGKGFYRRARFYVGA